uniref:G-protein coupled receptors family 1 profile domain-containing protein n=1 Tax=Plectus sambesii TaxID=2011161 RepID=A0A914X5U7_9BILA
MQSTYIPIGIFGIFGNALVLIAYLSYKKMRAIDCAHLIAALSVGNVISGFGALLISASRLQIAIFNDFNFSRFNCIFGAVVVFIGLEMSQAITMAIAIDRLKAVSDPFAYPVAKNRLFAGISFVVSILAGLSNIILSVVGVDFSTQPSRCNWCK